jgi:hypothetical protein
MFGRLHHGRDPFWGDGQAAVKTRRHHQVQGAVALAIAIAACGLTAAVWLLTLAPLMAAIGPG